MKTIREHISAKLLLSYFVVLLVGATVLLFGVVFAAPGAYSRHMQMNEVGMMGGAGRIQGMGQGGQGPGFINFRDGVLESLGYAVGVAILGAVAVSVIFSRQIVAPLRAMMSASQRIADGRYDERVEVSGSDELAQLAQRFNRMAERLEQTESMRRQLIGDVSHELRTPLTAIGGYMEGLMDGVLPADIETFEQVRKEAQRLGRLVEDLQELSRVEAGSYRLDLQPINLPDLIETIVKRFSQQFQDKGVSLIPVRDEISSRFGQLQPVKADEDRIIQVMTNLLANALIYTPAGGSVNITAENKGRDIQLEVKDSGVGISTENLPHIFDRFFRVDKSRSRAAGAGSGIGLTIARAIVEAHGGRLWVESPGEGLGSSFMFTLPASK